MVQTWPRLCLYTFPPIALLPGVLERVCQDRVLPLLIVEKRPGQNMVPRFNIPSRRASSGAPRQEGPFVPSRGLDISPPTRTVETVGLASEGAQLIHSGLSTEVVVSQPLQKSLHKFSLHGVMTISCTQLTAQSV